MKMRFNPITSKFATEVKENKIDRCNLKDKNWNELDDNLTWEDVDENPAWGELEKESEK